MREIDVLIAYFERARDLSQFAKKEVNQFHAGEVDRISTNEELRKRFGMRRDKLFRDSISGEGVGEIRREAQEAAKQKTKEERSIVQSSEWAWMIGVLSGGGHNNLTGGNLSIAEFDEAFLQTIKSTGERIIDSNGYIRTIRVLDNGVSYRTLAFHDRSISAQLGDLRRDRWPQTIIQKHSWILRNHNYLANFLGGIFDTRGRILPQQGIFLSSSYPVVVNFLSELLVRMGVENPKPKYQGKEQEKLIGVGIYNLQDIKTFADQVHSRRPEKETALEIFRQNGPVKPKADLESLMVEYKRAREITLRGKDRLPTIHDIAELRSKGVIIYTASTLANFFGDRSFVKARENLEDIIARSETDQTTEIPAPRIRVYARRIKKDGVERYDPRDKLIEEYRKAREICLQEKGRLPMIKDIDELRDRIIVSYTAHTLANYFGGRSFIRAREELERIIREGGEE